MITLVDLANISSIMDQQMLELNVKYKEDFRDDLFINFALPELDLQTIDEELYKKEHEGSLVGYEKGDEIDVKILGINFRLTKKVAE